MVYRVEVKVVNEDRYIGNELRFHTIELAKEYAVDLFYRWTSVVAWRIVDETGVVVFEEDFQKRGPGVSDEGPRD